MKRTLIAIVLLTLILTACAPVQETSEAPSVKETEENVVENTTVPTEIPEELPTATLEPTATEAPTSTPEPTAEPTPTSTPDLGQQPYFDDFSETTDDWEVVFSKNTTATSLENEQYALEASGITAAVVSSPKSITNASELSIEVDISFAQTGNETGAGGIVCGYAWEKAFYGLGVEKFGSEYFAVIAETTDNSTLENLHLIRLTNFKDQQSYHLQAICSSTGLGLIIDGKKILRYPLTEFRPGRIGLFSTGAYGINSDATETFDMPNKVVFDNFAATTMQTQDEWVGAPIDPFEYLSVGEVIYSEDFSAPTGVWSLFNNPGQTAKFENGKLTLTDITDEGSAYSILESKTYFDSGVMMETNLTLSPGSSEYVYIGFLCDIDGNWNNLYELHYSRRGSVHYFKYSNGSWKGIGGSSFPSDSNEDYDIENGRTYHLTGICGAGYLALLVDGVPEFYIPIPEQKFHSVGLLAGLGYPQEGEATFLFDNFKITSIDPIID
jgi:hypothetical protein